MSILFCVLLVFNVTSNYTFVYDSNDGASFERKEFIKTNSLVDKSRDVNEKALLIYNDDGEDFYFNCEFKESRELSLFPLFPNNLEFINERYIE